MFGALPIPTAPKRACRVCRVTMEHDVADYYYCANAACGMRNKMMLMLAHGERRHVGMAR